MYTAVLRRGTASLRGGADKSLARPTSRCRRTEWCCRKEESLHVPNCKSFLVTRAERKDVRRRARFQHGDASCHQVFFLQGKPPKEIHAILTETLGEHAPSYATVKNWVAQFKRGDFSTCDRSEERRVRERV